MAVNGVYDVDIDQENECKWFSFIPEEDGEYSFYATGSYETEGYFLTAKSIPKRLSGIRELMTSMIVIVDQIITLSSTKH